LRSGLLALVVAIGLAGAMAGCGRPASGAGLRATQAPAGPAAATPDALHATPSAPPAPPPAAGDGPPPVVPVGVAIGNNPTARPQSGLDRADVVWEIPAEGGITRFFAIFASTGSARIGPVRSTRIDFDVLARAYGIPIAHAGGNVDALNALAAWHLQNLDEIYGAGGFFWRSSDRVAPDNLYTSTALLDAAVRHFRFSAPPLRLPARGPLAAEAVPASSVDITYAREPAYTYVAGWRWQDGWWRRTVDGVPQATLDGQPVRAGTVIILVVPVSPDPDPYTPGAIRLNWGAGGRAWLLREGTSVAGDWRLGPDGLPEVLAGGRVLAAGNERPYWYEVVPAAADVALHG
jgi:hypothetical protein